MTGTTDDTVTFTIALTEDGEPAEQSVLPFVALSAFLGGVYYILRMR